MTAVDHAELKRLAVSMSDPEIDGYKMPGKTANVWAARLSALIADSEAKDAEIEGLKAERDGYQPDGAELPTWSELAEYWRDRALRTQAPDSWRPIETAPKDGARILLSGMPYGPKVDVGAWGSTAYNRSAKAYNSGWTTFPGNETNPTHWMPLPAAPALRPQTAESGT